MRKISLLVVLLFSISLAQSQIVNDIFKSAPFDVLPGISEENKSIMLVDKSAIDVQSSLGEVSKLEHTDSYIKLKTSNIGTTQIKILPSEENKFVVCVIKTVCDSACDSSIKFYNSDWEELGDSVFMPNLSLDLFVNMESDVSIDVAPPIFLPILAELDGDSYNLVIKVDFENIISKQQINSFMPYVLYKEITLQWNNDSFTL